MPRVEPRTVLKKNQPGTVERFSARVTAASGSNSAFIVAVVVVIVWAITGPIFNYSETWQLVINTGTTIITFLMVFLIQKSQNKDSLAIQLKLNELVAAVQGASNRLIDVESLTEQDLAALHRYFSELATLARTAGDVTESHSVEEARARHSFKLGGRKTAAKDK